MLHNDSAEQLAFLERGCVAMFGALAIVDRSGRLVVRLSSRYPGQRPYGCNVLGQNSPRYRFIRANG
jgi:hypothetical protein